MKYKAKVTSKEFVKAYLRLLGIELTVTERKVLEELVLRTYTYSKDLKEPYLSQIIGMQWSDIKKIAEISSNQASNVKKSLISKGFITSTLGVKPFLLPQKEISFEFIVSDEVEAKVVEKKVEVEIVDTEPLPTIKREIEEVKEIEETEGLETINETDSF
jgi:hypothetical protein